MNLKGQRLLRFALIGMDLMPVQLIVPAVCITGGKMTHMFCVRTPKILKRQYEKSYCLLLFNLKNKNMNTDYETMVEPLTEEERMEYQASNYDAAVYASTYHKYNCGSLAGMWVNLEIFSDSEELYKFLHRLHADEENPEFMFQDFENFPKKFYEESSCDFEGLFQWLALDEDDRKKVAEYWDEVDSDRDVKDILDAFVYEGDANEFYGKLADILLENSDCPDSIRPYFDYGMWERDCSYDYSETTHYLFSAH